MNKIRLGSLLIIVLSLVGCSSFIETEVTQTDDEDTAKKDTNEESTDVITKEDQHDLDEDELIDETENTEDTEATEDSESIGQSETSLNIPDLKLQLQKIDKEAGKTIENNVMYAQLNAAIEADPKKGLPNDFSVYPYNIVDYEDGSMSLLFFAVNRLHAPIKNIYFEITLGNVNTGEYIYEQTPVTLEEDTFGIINTDSTIPFLLDINQEGEALLNQLTNENGELLIENTELDFVE
ncbi:hypothetical protein [Gracilibacillus kekensis]|uniref:Lipoprotein n=1 Tax=Gracilibacillus kekensis TaxID=1027249 RepID=A0A1M7JNF3_9BACI|nr:hypothetical protein [Gracilibacillus kekensis]SHM54534.1 hypothetical protein SAMN05216179_0425 [Gracilibacillus kekensis]